MTKPYWIYGKHAAFAAISNSKRKCLEVRCTTKYINDIKAIRKLPLTKVEQRDFDNFLPKNAVHQGVAVLVDPLAKRDLESCFNASKILILDQISDLQNAGTIIRTALAFGYDHIIAPKDSSFEEGPTLAKAAVGALERINIIRVTNLVDSIKRLKQQGFWFLGMDGGGNMELSSVQRFDKIALVLGAEDKGIRPLTKKHCDLLVRINIANSIESLNVAQAAAIAMYGLQQD
jgi:23S rRNA (guanosine2251-2'-O)-methyltransferase